MKALLGGQRRACSPPARLLTLMDGPWILPAFLFWRPSSSPGHRATTASGGVGGVFAPALLCGASLGRPSRAR
jgi:hypothetical protein